MGTRGMVKAAGAVEAEAGVRLVVQRSRSGRSDYEYHQLIQAAQRYGKVPAGKTSELLVRLALAQL